MKIRRLLCAVLACSLFFPVLAIAASASEESAGFDWPLGRALPHFGAPAEPLDAIDIIEMPLAERLAVACLQGVVNRARPRIFLVDRDYDTRDSWGPDLGLSYEFMPWKDVLLKYLEEIKGLVIFNPEIRDTNNAACTVAGIKDALAVSPALAEELAAAPYHLPILVDLRDAPITDKLSAYRWVHANYWDQCTRRTISGLAPDGHFPLRDFSVAVRAAILWLDPKIPEERAVLKLFFDDTKPLDCYYTGWWPNEGAGISFASAYGVMTIASDFYLNYTVYSGMPRELDAIPPVPAKPELEQGKIYLSLNISDGDNIQYDQGAMRVERLWGSPQRGEVPIGWTFSPVMLDAGPQILNWYYKTATENDVLICGPSGLGYSTAAEWPNKAFVQRYGTMTNDYFERSNMNIITVWQKITASRANWYLGAMPGLLGITTQFENGNFSPKVRHYGGKPVIWLGSDTKGSRGSMSYDNGIDNIMTHMRAAAKKNTAEPRFFMGQVDVWHTGVSDLVRLADDLNAEFPGRFVFVRPDHLMMLVNEYYIKPFNVALQKPAVDENGDPAAITDGTFTTGWEAKTTGPAALRIDLGEPMKLDRFVLKNAGTNYLDASLNTKAWELRSSVDGETWKTLETVSANSKPIVYRKLSGTARYIRLVITDAGADDVARVQELEIYGVPAARANDAQVKKMASRHDLRVRLTNPWYEFVEWLHTKALFLSIERLWNRIFWS